MMALAGVELETLISEPDALTTRPPPCDFAKLNCHILVKECNFKTNKYLRRQ